MITKQAPAGRREVFDRYWLTRELSSADARTRQRTTYCARMIRKKTGRLLDVGCGRGDTAAYFAGRGFHVLGIDVSPMSVAWTREHGIEARIVDLENDPLDGRFDVIICLETLQYMNDPVAVLMKLKRALAADGELILSLPNMHHLARTFSKMSDAPDEDTYARTSFRPAEHRRLIECADLQATAVRPLSLIPPRWRILAGPGQLAARWFPTFFALSVMYRLVEKNK